MVEILPQFEKGTNHGKVTTPGGVGYRRYCSRDVSGRDSDKLGDAKWSRGIQDGAEAFGTVGDDASLDVRGFGAAQEEGSEQVGKSGVRPAEDAEVAGGEVLCNFEEKLVRDGERHGEEVIVIPLVF